MNKLKSLAFIILFASASWATDITISFDNSLNTRILDAFSNVYGWTATIPDPENPGQTIPNPETKAQFAKRMLAKYVKEVVKAYESTVAGEAARKTAQDNAEAQVIVQ